MYSRHAGLSIPKNYNGVRFRSPPDNTQTKEHRPIYTQAVKNAHSPLYNDASATLESRSDPPLINTSDTEISFTEESPTPNITDVCETDDYNIDNETADTPSPDTQQNESLELNKDNKNSLSISSIFDTVRLPIAEIIRSVNREDVLLLGLILLLASEQETDNSSILTFLTLLLLKR